jgi:hypothetical protein
LSHTSRKYFFSSAIHYSPNQCAPVASPLTDKFLLSCPSFADEISATFLEIGECDGPFFSNRSFMPLVAELPTSSNIRDAVETTSVG